ncbi:MAG: RNA polymerase sigma factor [Candidatus Poribacteria bacterium]
MAQEPTDQELVIRLKSGDVTALSALDQRYRVRIIRLIAELAKSYEEAEDIYQEAIFKAATHIASFDHRRSFYNWLHRIAKNQCIDEYRRRGQTEMVEGDEILLKLTTTDRSPLDGVIDSELQEKIQKAIDVLPERQQSVAKLRLLEGLNYKEIARRIGGSVHAVKSLFSVARKTLKTQLQFYLGCFAYLRTGTKGMETSTSTTMGVSGFLSLTVHLIVSVALFYGATDGIDTKERGKSKETSITFITGSADSRVSLRRIERHRRKKVVWEPRTFEQPPSTKLSQKREIDWTTRKSLPLQSLIISDGHETSLSFPPDETGLEFHESDHLISSERAFVPAIGKRSYRRVDKVTANLFDLHVNQVGSMA